MAFQDDRDVTAWLKKIQDLVEVTNEPSWDLGLTGWPKPTSQSVREMRNGKMDIRIP